jgi:hypothetical protein
VYSTARVFFIPNFKWRIWREMKDANGVDEAGARCIVGLVVLMLEHASSSVPSPGVMFFLLSGSTCLIASFF